MNAKNSAPRLFPLRLKLVLLTTGLSVLLAAIFLWFFASRLTEVAEFGAERHALGVAGVVANAVAPGIDFEEAGSVTDLLQEVTLEPEINYAAVVREDGSNFAVSGDPSRLPKTLLDPLPEAATFLVIENTLHAAAPVRGRAGGRATLIMGFSLNRQREQNTETRDTAVTIAIMVIGLGLAVSFLIGTLIAKPIIQLTHVTRNIVAEGDLTQQIVTGANDEVGLLADNFAQMVEKLRVIPVTLQEMVDGVIRVTDRLSKTVQTLSSGADIVHQNIESTSNTMEETLVALQAIADTVSHLNNDAQDTRGTNEELLSLTDEVRNNVLAMVQSVDASAEAVGTMTESAQAIARNVDSLDEFAESTSSAMTQMAASIASVNVAAQDTTRVSARVGEAAEEGVRAIGATLHGIETIEAASSEAVDAINALGHYIKDIGGIVDIISDVADQTNLLSLNAAIIAAQAGEHGRGFSVVADSIKALADRTSSSTDEISSLIQRIKSQAEKALAAVSNGAENVKEGVALGTRAGSALNAIRSAAGNANDHMRSIAVAANQQADSVNDVSDSIQALVGTVQKINASTRKQAQDADRIMQLTEEMRTVTSLVTDSSRAQADRSGRIAVAVERMSGSIAQINRAQGGQTAAAQKTLAAFRTIENETDTQSTSVDALANAMSELREQAAQLREAVSQFKT